MNDKNNTRRAKGKVKEIGGAIKKGVGRLLGNEQMAAEGRAAELKGQAHQESAKAGERIKGKVEEIGGSIKNGLGQLIDNEQMEIEGKVKKLKGQARQEANK